MRLCPEPRLEIGIIVTPSIHMIAASNLCECQTHWHEVGCQRKFVCAGGCVCVEGGLIDTISGRDFSSHLNTSLGLNSDIGGTQRRGRDWLKRTKPKVKQQHYPGAHVLSLFDSVDFFFFLIPSYKKGTDYDLYNPNLNQKPLKICTQYFVIEALNIHWKKRELLTNDLLMDFGVSRKLKSWRKWHETK